MLFKKKPEPDDKPNRAIPVAIPLKIKDPEFYRILTSDDAEAFLTRSRSFQAVCLDLIYDYWCLSKAVSKHADPIKQPDVSELVQRFGDTLKKHGFMVKDMTGQNYNDGMVLDVIHFEKSTDASNKSAFISETIRPAIYLHDRLIQKSEVVVTRPNGD